MIQRIQSLYLLLCVIAYVLLFFFPVAHYNASDMVYNFSLLGISNANSNSTFPLIFAVAALGLTVLVTIFLFKKRMIQIRITQIVLLAHIALLVAFFYVSDSIGKRIGTDAVYDVAAYLALIPLAFLVLANRAIIKDEKLVRSTDRLRD